MKLKTKYLIIGSGLSGLTAAYYLKDNYILAEEANVAGGTAGTLEFDGFNLDHGVHILYFKHEWVKDFITNSLEVKLLNRKRECAVWLDNSFVNYPVQYNLSELPLYSKIRFVNSIFFSLFRKSAGFNNLEDYSSSAFGDYLTKIFIRPYNEKIFCSSTKEINCEWMGDYVPLYSKRKMILSLTGLMNSTYGRNYDFYYPAEGGIASIAKSLSFRLKVKPLLNCSLIKLSVEDKRAHFSNGVEVNYNFLINTSSLKNFLGKIDALPSVISNNVNLLKYNSTTILHILCEEHYNQNKFHWVYIPDKNIPFYRITFPGNINPANCPDKHYALTLEFGGDYFENETILNSSISSLEKLGLLSRESKFKIKWKLLNCGYVLYNQDRAKVLSSITPFLERNNIFSVGRYGRWEYSNMEDAIIAGKTIADHLNE